MIPITTTGPRTRRVARAAFRAIFAACLATAAPAAGAAAPAAEARRAPAARPRVEVAFVLDTTGSMSGLIEGAKQKIWEIARRIASAKPAPDVRMALVAYRDRGDSYVTERTELTDDIDRVYARLRELRADGGGDGPESVNQALHDAVTRLGWSSDANVYRVVFLVGDAPPHMDYPDDVKYPQTLRVAQRKGIVVNTVQCGAVPETAQIWRAIALAGEGRYVAIAQDGGMQAVATPFDDDLARVGRDLAATIVPWGRAEEQAEIRGKARVAAAAPPPAAAERLAFLERSGGRANLGRRDLVDAVKSGAVDARTVPDAELPPELAALAPDARRAFVEERLAKREALQRDAHALTEQREAWLRAEAERRASHGAPAGFDATVLEAIRAQSARHGLAFE